MRNPNDIKVLLALTAYSNPLMMDFLNPRISEETNYPPDGKYRSNHRGGGMTDRRSRKDRKAQRERHRKSR